MIQGGSHVLWKWKEWGQSSPGLFCILSKYSPGGTEKKTWEQSRWLQN